MPTPRAHGGAALQHFPLNLPGFRGLNKQARGAVLGPEWATRLENTVLDGSSRVAARKGWRKVTATAIGAQIVQLFEFNNAGVFELIATADDNTIHKSTDGGENWTDITGAATITDPNMQLISFNNVVMGFQDGEDPIRYTGTGDFADVSSAGVPDGNAALGAFGRVWAKDGDLVVKYSALLDETDWDGSDTGSFDLTSVIQEQDEIVGLAEFNGALVIFLKRNIVVYTDGQGSALGLDPIQAYVVDTISGIGCIARDTIRNVKGDLWFLDDTGLHNLGRLVGQKSNPLINLSTNVQDELKSFVDLTTGANLRAVYSPADRFYLLCIPLGTGTTENGVAFCFDTRGMLEDGSARCTGIWNQMVPKAVIRRDNLDLIIALRSKEGEVGVYDTFSDDTNGKYVLEYESGWTDLETPNLKLMKRLSGLLFIQAATTVSFKWAFDFENEFKSASVIYPAAASAAEWGEAEWNEDEWGGGVNIREKRVGGRGSGEYIKVGMSIEIDGDEVSVQQLALYAKEGRLR